MPAETAAPISNFEYALNKQFSIASLIAQIALDPELMHGADVSIYPPVLTPRDITSQMFVRSEGMDRATEDSLRKTIDERLATWTAEGFFEVRTLPGRQSGDNIAYTMSRSGASLAIAKLRADASGLKRFANKADAKITQ